MRENNVRKIWQQGGNVVNGWLAIPHSFAAEVMAHCGWDALTVDMQHGLADYGQALQMLQAISYCDVTPLVRVPWNEPGLIQRMLDAGAYGIICPMINNRAECEAFVQVCKYPPLGSRSFGPVRAALYAGTDYVQHANDTVIAMAMVETKAAIDNLDDILSVPGLDAVYVGPSDLGISIYGKPHADSQDPEFLKLHKHIVDRCKAHGVVPGLHVNTPEYAVQMAKLGYQLTTIAGDSRLLSVAATEAVNKAKAAAGTSKIVY